MTNFFNYTFILCVNNFHIKYLLLYVFYTIYYEIFFKISIYFIFKTKIFILIKLFRKKKKVIKVKVKNFHHFFPIIFSNLKINVNRLDHLINLCTLLHRKNSSITHERRTCSLDGMKTVSSCQKGVLQFSSSQRARLM